MKLLFNLCLIIIALGSCNQNEKISYGYYKSMEDKSGEYPGIMYVYNINETTLETNIYNKNKKIKYLSKPVSLTWATSNNGLKVGYNLSESECYVFYKNQFYRQFGECAKTIINDLNQSKDFDNSLFLEKLQYSILADVKIVTNDGLVKLTDEEQTEFQNSLLATENNVLLGR
jgi:hypothetical protein